MMLSSYSISSIKQTKKMMLSSYSISSIKHPGAYLKFRSKRGPLKMDLRSFVKHYIQDDETAAVREKLLCFVWESQIAPLVD